MQISYYHPIPFLVYARRNAIKLMWGLGELLRKFLWLPEKYWALHYGGKKKQKNKQKNKTKQIIKINTKPHRSCGISRDKNLQSKEAFMSVCKGSCAKQDPIHQHRGHKLLGSALAVKCSMDGCNHRCSAHALVRDQAALVSTEAGFYHLHKLLLAECTQHVINSPSHGSGTDGELEAGVGWEWWVPPGRVWCCCPSGPRATLE